MKEPVKIGNIFFEKNRIMKLMMAIFDLAEHEGFTPGELYGAAHVIWETYEMKRHAKSSVETDPNIQ